MESNLGKLSCLCECGTSFDYHIPLGYGEMNIHCPICKKYIETVEITGEDYSRKISVSSLYKYEKTIKSKVTNGGEFKFPPLD